MLARKFHLNLSIRARQLSPRSGPRPTRTLRLLRAAINYYQPIPNINNGWIYRVRLDYQLGANTKIYGSYQQAFDSQLAQGNGAHLYWTPGNAIPYPWRR